MCALIVFKVMLITKREWVYSLTNLRRRALTSCLSPWQCGRNVGCCCLDACHVRKAGETEIERDRQRERECRKSSRKGVKEHSVRKLPALNTNICGYRWTSEHVCTHTHTQPHTPVSGVLASTVSLSVLSAVTWYQVKNSLWAQMSPEPTVTLKPIGLKV